MAEVTSGYNLTVFVLHETELAAVRYLLDRVSLLGTDEDEHALRTAAQLLDAIGVDIHV